MDDGRAKAQLHDRLRSTRASLLAKLEGASEYDVRRPLTVTGTNLLGLVKHLAMSEARYFSEVFGKPAPWPLRWDSDDMWAAQGETREDILGRYQHACDLADATINELDLDAAGHVPWWPQPDVTLYDVMIHLLAETSRHAGHADILREQMDGVVGQGSGTVLERGDPAYWTARRSEIERAAAVFKA